jgi:hypothetical protein
MSLPSRRIKGGDLVQHQRDARGRVTGFRTATGKWVSAKTALVPEQLPLIADVQDEFLFNDPREEKVRLTKDERDALLKQRYLNSFREGNTHIEQEVAA